MNAAIREVARASAAPLQVGGLTHRYDAKIVLDHVRLALTEGSVLGVIGRNGAGKSTLVHATLGLLESDAGSAFVFGEPTLKLSDSAKERLGYVPQQPDAPTAGAGRTGIRTGSGDTSRTVARDRAARRRGRHHRVVLDPHRV